MALWWIGNAVLLLVVVPLVVALATQIIRLLYEVNRYAEDILEHGVGITANLEPVPALLDTRDLVDDVADEATRYVTGLDRSI